MKNLRYMLIAVYSAFLLLPLGSCMDTDMNRNKYEVDSEEIGRENYDLGSTIRGLQGLVIPAQGPEFLISNYGRVEMSGDLRPYEAFIARVR